MTEVIEKECNKCFEKKKLIDFVKCKKSKDGYAGYCKGCKNKYHRDYNKNRKNIVDKKLYTYLKFKLDSIKSQDYRKFPEHISELTEEDLVEIYNKYGGECVYTKQKLKPGSKVNIYKKISYDRIDNTLPHTKENLQLTSQFANIWRGNKSHEEFSKLFEEN